MTTEYQTQLDDHEERLADIEKWRGDISARLDNIGQELAATRAEGNARAAVSMQGIDRLGLQITSLGQQVSENTGAQKRQVQIQEQQLITAQTRLAQMKYWGCVFGILFAAAGALGGTLLSSQTWDDYLFGHVGFLHHRVSIMQ